MPEPKSVLPDEINHRIQVLIREALEERGFVLNEGVTFPNPSLALGELRGDLYYRLPPKALTFGAETTATLKAAAEEAGSSAGRAWARSLLIDQVGKVTRLTKRLSDEPVSDHLNTKFGRRLARVAGAVAPFAVGAVVLLCALPMLTGTFASVLIGGGAAVCSAAAYVFEKTRGQEIARHFVKADYTLGKTKPAREQLSDLLESLQDSDSLKTGKEARGRMSYLETIQDVRSVFGEAFKQAVVEQSADLAASLQPLANPPEVKSEADFKEVVEYSGYALAVDIGVAILFDRSGDTRFIPQESSEPELLQLIEETNATLEESESLAAAQLPTIAFEARVAALNEWAAHNGPADLSGFLRSRELAAPEVEPAVVRARTIDKLLLDVEGMTSEETFGKPMAEALADPAVQGLFRPSATNGSVQHRNSELVDTFGV